MLTTIALVLVVLNSSLAGPLSRLETAKPRADDIDYRLPTNIVPKTYDIRLVPDIVNEEFSGSVKITIEVKEPTNTIILHKRQLTITDAATKIEVKTEDGTTQLDIKETIEETEIPEREFFKIVMEEELAKGKYTVDIPDFQGTLNEDLQGFYIAKYVEEGVTKKFATTQFEPTGARRAFPCFDEPSMKAKFKITLVRPKNYNSVSNMKLFDSRPGTNNDEDIFEETVEMSTYLIAFIVSELKLTDVSKPQRVLAKQKDIEAKKAEFALETGDTVLTKIGEFVSVPYSLDKMDQAAIPDAFFSAGAMENWGLVTYKETALLYSPLTTLTSRHQSIATIIAHEFGHQWFGNLVTPKWWEYIWLNEGFATYFEYWGGDQAEPDWDIMDQFVIKNTQYAFQPDSLESTRPMNFNAGTPSEISALFDRIAYEKSGSVIRMMESFLTTDIFKKGLKNYLTANEYGIVTPDDLYKGMQDAVNEKKSNLLPNELTVSKIMKSWDSVKGYPVIKVSRKYNTNENNVNLEQSQFLLKKSESVNTNNWIIPINYVTKNNGNINDTTPIEWLTGKTKDITVENLEATDWLIINKKQTGYYRVNYDEINWMLLSDALNANHTSIHILNRAQLIDDSFNLARSGRLSYSVPLQLSLYLRNEVEYIPFYSFFNAISFLNVMISGNPAQNYFEDHIKDILKNVYEHLGFKEKSTDKHVDKLNRASVLTWACNLDYSDCRSKSQDAFNDWKEKSITINIDLQTPIFCSAMRAASQEDWEYLYEQYKKPSEDAQLQSRMLSGLGCSENIGILNGFLEKAVEGDDSVSPSKAFETVYNAGSVGLQTSFDYISDNFDKVYAKLENNLQNVLNGIAAKLSTQEQFDKLKALAEAHSEQENLFKTALEKAKENIDWNNENLSDITGWFTKDDTGSSSNIYSSIFITILSYSMCTIY